MKIKVTFEKVFDSNELYGKLENITFNEFKSIIRYSLWEWAIDMIIENLKFEEIEE